MKRSNLLKILVMTLAVAVSLSLFACDGKDNEEDTQAPSHSTESTAVESAEEKTEQTTPSKTEQTTQASTETDSNSESMSDTDTAEEESTADGSETATHDNVTTAADETETTEEESTTAAKENNSMSGNTEKDPLKDPTNIITLNKDKEALVIQGASRRSDAFKDKYEVLQFVHCSDMHAAPENWERMVEWVNYYSDYVQFVIHSGDYVGGNQGTFVDFYEDCTKCDVPIWNLVGNHDTMKPGTSQQQNATKESVWKLLFEGQCETWGVTFMDIEYSMAYYQDQPKSNTRMICLDMYYDIEPQKIWLKDLLDDAKDKGLHVITVMHEPSNRIEYPVNTAFHTAVDYESLYSIGKCVYEDTIADFIENGGIHIANLVGHEHHDFFGYTLNGVLNIAVESGTAWDYWCDGSRVEGTKTFDAFNVVSVDTNLGMIKIVRIGDDADIYLRERRAICYDYINKKMINGAASADSSDSGSSAKPDYSYTAPEYVNKYMGWRQLASQPNGSMFNMTGDGVAKDGDTLYYRMFCNNGNVAAQIFWTRIGGATAATWGPSQINPIEVGKAKYLVIKMRSNCDIQSIVFRIGTIVGQATWENQSNMHIADITIPQKALDGTEWTTFVIDLSTTMGDGWVADSDGNYKICYLQYTFNDYSNKFPTEMYFDFSYMAFVDDWTEISDLVDTDNVDLITSNNVSKKVPKTGEKAPDPVASGYHLTASQIKSDANNGSDIGSVELKNDESFDYVRMTNNSTGAANPTFVHSYADVSGNCGKYMIFKYRTNAATWLHYGYSQSAEVTFSDSERTWTTLSNDEQWHVIIVDMSQTSSDDSNTHFIADCDGSNYTVKGLGFRLFYQQTSNANAYMDMAYIKWANTIEEAKTLIGDGESVSAGYYDSSKFVAISI